MTKMMVTMEMTMETDALCMSVCRASIWSVANFIPASLPEGTVFRSHIPSFSNLSRISQLNIPGLSRLYSSILFSTSGVVPCCGDEKSCDVYNSVFRSFEMICYMCKKAQKWDDNFSLDMRQQHKVYRTFDTNNNNIQIAFLSLSLS